MDEIPKKLKNDYSDFKFQPEGIAAYHASLKPDIKKEVESLLLLLLLLLLLFPFLNLLLMWLLISAVNAVCLCRNKGSQLVGVDPSVNSLTHGFESIVLYQEASSSKNRTSHSDPREY